MNCKNCAKCPGQKSCAALQARLELPVLPHADRTRSEPRPCDPPPDPSQDQCAGPVGAVTSEQSAC